MSATTVSLHTLQSNTVPLETLEAAFGPDSLGIILVSDLPAEYASLRTKLLSLASHLANLPGDELAKLEREQARWNVGWSCGKERLRTGQPDTLKGSYYVQPIASADGAPEARARREYPDLVDMTSANVWPAADVLPGFEPAFLRLCRLIVDVAALVARSCDRFGVANIEGYRAGTLEGIVRGSVSTKARLLHYFPPPDASPSAVSAAGEGSEDSAVEMEDDWCGTHTDLGALTGLTSNMYVDEAAHPPLGRSGDSHDGEQLPNLPEMDSHPDTKAGLWIKDRQGRTTKVDIPRDCLAFQTGEALSLITKGRFKAVPHFVRGSKTARGGKIARNTLAVFTQPNLWEIVDEGRGLDFAGLAQEIFGKTY